jgi:hypothetical protein
MYTEAQAREPQMGLNFEQIWAALMELRESHRETERLLRESQRESREDFDRRMRESNEKAEKETQALWEAQRETAWQMKKTDESIGKLGNRFGELAEHLVVPNIVEKFNALGFNFTKYGPNVSISDKSKNIAAEVDIFLENRDCAIAVEVKAQLKIDDIKDHVERMKTLRRYADAHQNPRKFYGAVAGAIIYDNVREYALKEGFFGVSKTGDTMKITVSEDFKPKEW